MKILSSWEISYLDSKIFSSLTYLKQEKTNFSAEVFTWRENEAQSFFLKGWRTIDSISVG
jgi:hypothetical protein